MKLRSKVLLLLLAALSFVLMVPAMAFGAEPDVAGQFVFPSLQVWAIVAGSLVTVVTYLINRFAPWTGQGTKAFVLVITSAIAAGLTQSIDGGTVGFNDQTLQLVVTAVVAAFGSHLLLWKPSGIQGKLAQPEDAGEPSYPPGLRGKRA